MWQEIGLEALRWLQVYFVSLIHPFQCQRVDLTGTVQRNARSRVGRCIRSSASKHNKKQARLQRFDQLIKLNERDWLLGVVISRPLVDHLSPTFVLHGLRFIVKQYQYWYINVEW